MNGQTTVKTTVHNPDYIAGVMLETGDWDQTIIWTMVQPVGHSLLHPQDNRTGIALIAGQDLHHPLDSLVVD